MQGENLRPLSETMKGKLKLRIKRETEPAHDKEAQA